MQMCITIHAYLSYKDSDWILGIKVTCNVNVLHEYAGPVSRRIYVMMNQ